MDQLATSLGLRSKSSDLSDDDVEMDAIAMSRKRKQEVESDDDDETAAGGDDESVVRLQCAHWKTLDPVQQESIASRSQMLASVIHSMQGTEIPADDDGSASSATRERREKSDRKRAASSSHRVTRLGVGDKFPNGVEERAIGQSVDIEDLDTLRRQFGLHGSNSGVAAGAAAAASSVSPETFQTNPHATPWLDSTFSSLMQHLVVATPNGGVLHNAAIGREQIVRDLQQHRRSLPIFTTAYEEHLLVQAGNAPNPLLIDPACIVRRSSPGAPPRAIRWDPCCNGSDCIFYDCSNIYGKPKESFQLRCILFEDEFKILCELGQVQVNEPRPCLLCCRARAQRFVLAVKYLEEHVEVDISTNHQIFQNLVNTKNGFAQDFVLSPTGVYAGFFSPIAVFRESLLSAKYDHRMELWRIDQSAMYYTQPTLPAPQSGETMKPQDQLTLYERRLLHDWKNVGHRAYLVVCDLTHYDTVENVHGSQIWDAHRPSGKDAISHILTKVLPQSCRTRSASTVLGKYTRVDSIQSDIRTTTAQVRAIVQFLQGGSQFATASGKPSRDQDELASKLDRRNANRTSCKVVSRWIVCSLLCNYSFSECHFLARRSERAEIRSWSNAPVEMVVAFLESGMQHIYIWAVRDYLCYVIRDDPVLNSHLRNVFDVDAFMAITQQAWVVLRPIVIRAVRVCLASPTNEAVYARLPGMVGELIGVENVPFHRKILDIKYQRPLPPFDKMMASYDPLKNKWCKEVESTVDDMVDDVRDDDGIIVSNSDDNPDDEDPKRRYIDLTPEKLNDLPPYTIPFYHADLDHEVVRNQGTFCERLCKLFKAYKWDQDPRETPSQQREVLRPIPRRLAWTMFYWLRCYPSWFGPAEVAQHIIPGLFYFGVPRQVIVDILVICRKRDVDRIGRGKFGTEMQGLIENHPYAVRVLRAMCKMWREHQRFSVSSLSVDVTQRQMAALRDRFHIPAENVIPEKQMCLYFCACCKTIYSSVPLAHKDMRAITSNSSGWNDVVVDFYTGQFYCRRVLKIGCQMQPLYAVPLIGRVYCVNKNYFTLCPQPSCGRVMHINSGDPYYTKDGMACALCTRNCRSQHYHRMFREVLELSREGKVCCYQCTKHIKNMREAFIIPYGIILCKDHFYPNIISFLTERQINGRDDVKRALRDFYELVKEQNEIRNRGRNRAALARSRRQTRGFGART